MKGKQDALVKTLKHQRATFIDKETNSTVDDIVSKLDQLQKIKRQIQKLKNGSIINISQIRAISKMRVIDPKSSIDVFYNVSVSSDVLNKIDNKIKQFFTNPNKR